MILQFLNGDKSGEKKQVMPPGIGIGRETDNDIQLLIGGVSRYHAKLEIQDNKCFLRDLGSTNGTKLNGTLITDRVQLQNGDVIAIGEQMFRVDELPTEEKKENQPPAFVFRPPEAKTVTLNETAEIKQNPEASAPVQQQKTDADKKQTPDDYNVFSNGTSLFGKMKKKQGDSYGANTGAATTKKRANSTNALFYVLVIMIGVFVVALFWKFQSGDGKNKNTAKGQNNSIMIRNPFMLYYEKFTITKQNSVFKFKLLLENDQIKFSLDDLQSGRVYAPMINEKLPESAIEKLKAAIEDTNFMKSTQQENLEIEEENNRNYTRLIIGYDDKFNDLTIKDIPLASFTKVEQALLEFLQTEIGLDPSMAESKEVLLKEAKQRFDLAENQFNSYKNQPGNLWRSIENYRIAMKRYEVFADKPQEWRIARERFTKAQAILDRIRLDGSARVNLLYQQRELRKAIEECNRLMEFFPETSKTYQKIRQNKLRFESIIAGDKK